MSKDQDKNKQQIQLTTKEWDPESEKSKARKYIDPLFGKKGAERTGSLFGDDRTARLLNITHILLVLLLCGIVFLENRQKIEKEQQVQYKQLEVQRPDRSQEKELLKRQIEGLDKVVNTSLSARSSHLLVGGKRRDIDSIDLRFDPVNSMLHFSLLGADSSTIGTVEVGLVETATHAYAPEVRSCLLKFETEAYRCNMSDSKSNVVTKEFYLNGALIKGAMIEYLLSGTIYDSGSENGWYLSGRSPVEIGSSQAVETVYEPIELTGTYQIAGTSFEIADLVAIVRPRLDRIDLTFFREKLSASERRTIISRESATRREEGEKLPLVNVYISFKKGTLTLERKDIVEVEAEFMNPGKLYNESIEERYRENSLTSINAISGKMSGKEILSGEISFAQGTARFDASFRLRLIEIY